MSIGWELVSCLLTVGKGEDEAELVPPRTSDVEQTLSRRL